MNCPLCGSRDCSFLARLEKQMVLTSDQLGGRMTPKWGPADKEYGLNKDGQVCETNDPKVVSLLVAKGGYLDWQVAVKHGLAHEVQLGAPADDAGDSAPAQSKKSPLDLRQQKKPAAKARKK